MNKIIARLTLSTLICAFLIWGTAPGFAQDFTTSSKITQLVGDVSMHTLSGTSKAAALQDPIVPGDVLKTGTDSRVELTSGASTVIRVGANSVFSLSKESRQMELQQGSVLFHTDHGQGGGIIKTAAITAAVTGSTVAVTTTNGGGAKVCPLESPCKVTGANGQLIGVANPGQLLALIPGLTRPIIVNINLSAFVNSSGLIKGFTKPMGEPVLTKIDANVKTQGGKIEKTTDKFLVGLSIISNNGDPQLPSTIKHVLQTQNGYDVNVNTGNASVLAATGPLINKFTSDLTIDPTFLTSQASNIFNNQGLISQGLNTSALNYLSSNSGISFLDPKQISDSTLLNFNLGALSALRSSTLSPKTTLLIGQNLKIVGTSFISLGGRVFDLKSVQNSDALIFLALKNLSFIPTQNNVDNVLIFPNTSTNISFLAGGLMTIDGSALGTSAGFPNYLYFNMNTPVLSFGSVGDLSMKYADIDNTNKPGSTFSISSLGNVSLLACILYTGANGKMNITAGNTLNIAGTSTQVMSFRDAQSANGGITQLRMSANTINLQNIYFDPSVRVSLLSQLGVAGFAANQTNGVGKVNFNGNVVSGSSPDITSQAILNTIPNITVGMR